MWYTGVDPMTGKPVGVARHLRDRKLQRALMQFFKPENYFEVREALIQAKRTDLIGDGCDSLISANPPKEAIEARRRRADAAARNDHYHSVANPAAGEEPGERSVPPQVGNKGYRPGRKTQQRRQDKKKGGGPKV
jgi:Domain of unknown function (DUF3362)